MRDTMTLFANYNPLEKKPKTIRKVHDLSIGQVFMFEDTICRIDSFPTRYSVLLQNIIPVCWSFCKTSIRYFKSSSCRVISDPDAGGELRNGHETEKD